MPLPRPTQKAKENLLRAGREIQNRRRVACPFANTGRKRGPPDAPQVGLLSVGPGDLADKCGPADVHGRVNLASLRSSIILEDFHHQGCVVRDKTAGYYEPSRFAGL